MSYVTKNRALRAFKESLELRGFVPQTVARMAKTVLVFLAFAKKSVGRVTKGDVREYLAKRSGEVCTNSSALELDALHSFFAVLTEAELVEKDPTVDFELVRTPSRPPIVLSEDSVSRLLAEASTVNLRRTRTCEQCEAMALRNRAALELLYGVGFRRSEIVALNVVDLSLTDGSILCRAAKRGPNRYVPLPPASIPHLERYLIKGRPKLAFEDGRDEGRLFLGDHGRPWGKYGLSETVAEIGKRAGIKVHPHAFRRALATSLVRHGASLLVVRELLGHVRLDTTQKYVAVDRTDLRKAVDLLEAGGVVRAGRPSSRPRSGEVTTCVEKPEPVSTGD